MTRNRTITSAAKRTLEATVCAQTGLDWTEVAANHERLLARNASHRRFGYDPEAAVSFVVQKALPLHGAVLDVGTGKGRFLAGLAPHLSTLTTVDVSPEEQRFARLEACFAGVLDTVSFVTADAAALPWPAASFDAVVSMNAFHHFTHPEGVFTEMLRVLKAGGKLVLADFSPSGFELMDSIHRAEGRIHPQPPSHFAAWRTALQRADYTVRCFEGYHQEVMVAVGNIRVP